MYGGEPGTPRGPGVSWTQGLAFRFLTQTDLTDGSGSIELARFSGTSFTIGSTTLTKMFNVGSAGQFGVDGNGYVTTTHAAVGTVGMTATNLAAGDAGVNYIAVSNAGTAYFGTASSSHGITPLRGAGYVAADGTGGVVLSARGASAPISFYSNGLETNLRATIITGMQIGAPTGGDLGAGKLNTSAGVFKNGVEYATGGGSIPLSTGQVAYGDTAANSIKGTAGFWFDDVYKRLGIGTATKLSTLTVQPSADVTDLGGTTTANATTTITGIGTAFTTALGVGDRISLSSAASTYATIEAIARGCPL